MATCGTLGTKADPPLPDSSFAVELGWLYSEYFEHKSVAFELLGVQFVSFYFDLFERHQVACPIVLSAHQELCVGSFRKIHRDSQSIRRHRIVKSVCVKKKETYEI